MQTFCIIANQAQALGVHDIKIMITKWLQKRNCRVVKLPQVPVRLYADIYFILMLHQPLYNSCRDIKHYKCQHIWQNRGYFFLFMKPLSRDLTQRRNNKLQSDGFALNLFKERRQQKVQPRKTCEDLYNVERLITRPE